jgi:hypothetical protein
MTAKDAIKSVMNGNLQMMKMFLGDLSDADLMTRPVPGANHAAWQLGHLIASEIGLLSAVPGLTPTALPAGFVEKHSKDTAKSDVAANFCKKDEYLSLFDKVQADALAALDKLPDADLDKPTSGKMKDFAPTLGHLFLLTGNHIMMHAGQFTVLRRKLVKPVLF